MEISIYILFILWIAGVSERACSADKLKHYLLMTSNMLPKQWTSQSYPQKTLNVLTTIQTPSGRVGYLASWLAVVLIVNVPVLMRSADSNFHWGMYAVLIGRYVMTVIAGEKITYFRIWLCSVLLTLAYLLYFAGFAAAFFM